MRAREYIAWYPAGGCYVNLAGDYDYLESAYYNSQDYERQGKPIHPTCAEALDAYVPPLFLEKAHQAGLAVPSFYVSNGFFEPPVIIDPINPFMIRSRRVLKTGREHSIAKSMTRNFTYAICCQELPPEARITYFRAILGHCSSPRFLPLARAVWYLFGIPLAKVRVITNGSKEPLLSDISQLLPSKLTKRESAHLQGEIRWQK